MRVLIIDGGGRGHALGWKLRQSPRLTKLLAAPGNPGLGKIAECFPVKVDDVDGLLALAQRERADLTVVGPEVPLAGGIADKFRAAGLRIFGPPQAGAQIEYNKGFAMRLMEKHGIPTGWHVLLHGAAAVFSFAEDKGVWTDRPLVLKNPYLAGGKGAFICTGPMEVGHAVAEITRQQTGRLAHEFLAMEFLKGVEVSITAIVHGTDMVYLAPSQDHKYRDAGDKGDMTGGMGAIAPAPFVTPGIQNQIHHRIMLPAVLALDERMKRVGCDPYVGVLYAGLMLTADGPKVLEFNCRFGDPEAQVILPILEADLLEIMLAACDGRLRDVTIPPPRRSAACVVAASAGYPGTPQIGKQIHWLDNLGSHPDILAFQAGTKIEDGVLVTASGRVMSMMGLGDDLYQAIRRAYVGMGLFKFEGEFYRGDIGSKALAYLRHEAEVV